MLSFSSLPFPLTVSISVASIPYYTPIFPFVPFIFSSSTFGVPFTLSTHTRIRFYLLPHITLLFVHLPPSYRRTNFHRFVLQAPRDSFVLASAYPVSRSLAAGLRVAKCEHKLMGSQTCTPLPLCLRRRRRLPTLLTFFLKSGNATAPSSLTRTASCRVLWSRVCPPSAGSYHTRHIPIRFHTLAIASSASPFACLRSYSSPPFRRSLFFLAQGTYIAYPAPMPVSNPFSALIVYSFLRVPSPPLCTTLSYPPPPSITLSMVSYLPLSCTYHTYLYGLHTCRLKITLFSPPRRLQARFAPWPGCVACGSGTVADSVGSGFVWCARRPPKIIAPALRDQQHSRVSREAVAISSTYFRPLVRRSP
ncbi:hypothetical protein R3P38DRAFT_1329493 [Favolaschia claudopus]|uniref:Uncharacterized protein n=1 Tax=Favolaschia claudopus TaxID=2862362 RepID=A0AAW0ATT4_9AGAR